MKFFTLLAALCTVVYAQYCPITSGSCDTSKVPTSPKTAKLQLQYLVDGFKCSGTIEIDNDCQFSVKDFEVIAPGSAELKWFGSRELNAKEGGNNLSNEAVAQTAGPTNITVKTDHNMFCRASLIDHVGIISLMDDQNRVICFADLGKVSGGASGSSGSTGSTGSTGSGNTSKPGNATSTTGGTTNKTNNTSDARTAYMIPSTLSVVLLSLFISLLLYLRN